MRRMHAEERVGGNNERTDIKRGSRLCGYPIGIDFYEFFNSLKRVVRVDVRDAHTRVGIVHPFNILFRAEQQYSPVGGFICFHPLEHFLTVVENHTCRRKRNVAVGNDPCVVPAVFNVVIHNEHMVGKDLAETESALGFLLRTVCKSAGDIHFLCSFLMIPNIFTNNYTSVFCGFQ